MSVMNDPATQAKAVLPSNDPFLACRGLYVGGVGDVSVEMINGDVADFIGVAAGSILPLRVVKVLPATTATSIIALY